jgi:outer membrane immunogenic protein
MKFLLLSTTALAVLSGPVLANDVRIPSRSPVGPALYAWTGCYVGGHAGAGWDRSTFSDPGTVAVPFLGTVPVVNQNIAPPGASIGVDGPGAAIGGVQVGCDYQFATNWVIGLAGDFSWTHIEGQGVDPFFAGKDGGPIKLNTRTDSLASATGRVGYTWGNFLLYGKGGAAWAHDRYSITDLNGLSGTPCGNGLPIACNPTASTTRLGWTAGVGVEWAFANNWSALVEYVHYGFDNKTLAFTDPNANGPAFLNVKQNVDAVKLGINYRFAPIRP